MTLMQRLKAATAPAHARVEGAFALEDRLASRDAWMDVLRRLHVFHAAWEDVAARHVDEAFLAPRRKAHLLEQELEQELARAGADAPLTKSAPRFSFATDAARAHGGMYVIEGSMLGGAVIARRLERALGPDAPGRSFFRAYGDGLSDRWLSFGARMNALSSPAFDAGAVEGADAMFEEMRAWLSQDHVARDVVAA
ncbi:MAG TPA: biliverdin-producing heme oxygenase [Beijerinckiaceae bacterium]|jgi:heme oxygenase